MALTVSRCGSGTRARVMAGAAAEGGMDTAGAAGGVTSGAGPGARTAEYLGSIVTRITLAGAAFLAAIAIFPAFVTRDTAMPQTMQYFLCGTSVLIVVGVALELVDRLNAQLVMRNHGGFMKGSAGPGWTRKEKERA